MWQKGCDLTVAVHELTRRLPREERYGLSAQMRDAAASVPANIAEGAARGSRGDFVRFLRIAAGSLAELDTFIEVCQRLDYASARDLASLRAMTEEVGKMLFGLIASVRDDS
ncbi:MAG: four helix bundle protein [Armatimonadota bacterium]|nr:four helix bundle protein [Armatimonadota bacterium]